MAKDQPTPKAPQNQRRTTVPHPVLEMYVSEFAADLGELPNGEPAVKTIWASSGFAAVINMPASKAAAIGEMIAEFQKVADSGLVLAGAGDIAATAKAMKAVNPDG